MTDLASGVAGGHGNILSQEQLTETQRQKQKHSGTAVIAALSHDRLISAGESGWGSLPIT